MRNDIYRARARLVVHVRSHEHDVDSDPIMGGSTHPVGVPMVDAILSEEILRTWPIIRYTYIYVRVLAQMNCRGEWYKVRLREYAVAYFIFRV